jgi:hypothetical protein
VEGLNNANKVCAQIDNIENTREMEEHIAGTLADEENLPKFISLELDLTFVFK